MRYLLLVLLLAGCAAKQPLPSLEEEADMNCRRYGVPPEQMGVCMQREIASLRQQDAARAGLAMQYLANQPRPAYQPVPYTPVQTQPLQYRPPVQCRWTANVWTCQ